MGYNHKAIDLLLRSIDARDRTAHRSVVDFLVADNKHLRAELAAAIKQRDEARREICEAWAKQDGLPFDWKGLRGAEGMAQFLGWDCYEQKEGGGA